MEAGLRLMEKRTLGALIHHKGQGSEKVRLRRSEWWFQSLRHLGGAPGLGQPVRDTATGALGCGCCESKVGTNTLFVTAPKWEQLKYPSAYEWINKLWPIHVRKIFQQLKEEELS